MPIFEYSCRVCLKNFESIIGISQSDAPMQCLLCGATKLFVGKPNDTMSTSLPAVVRKFPLPSQHIWRGSSDGAMPKGKR